ncbi:hypothetical protein BaRGS_00037530, partial [Batillaria attramentaria]
MTTRCTECSATAANYKCPTCYARYCSVACCKLHKARECTPAELKESQKSPAPDSQHSNSKNGTQWAGPEETEDQVPEEKLAKLGESDSLRAVLWNRHLRAMMENLVNSEDPVSDMEAAMQEPIFVEFADECLKVVE